MLAFPFKDVCICKKSISDRRTESEIIAGGAANEAKTNFLAGMSHEIRTPMNAIIGMTSVARQECQDETICGYLDKIKSSSEFLLGLINDMLDTMYEAMGVGLAAPQVGILKRIVVIDIREGPIILINPEIIETSGEQTGEEGCLSLPGKAGTVTRPNYAKVKALNEDMEEVILADRIIVMDQGKIVMDGKPKEIFSRVDEMKTLGLEVPYATELAWELKKEGVNLSDTITTKEELVEELCQFV